MKPYEHKEGRGSLFTNDYKTTDAHPSHKGTFKWQGEVIEIAAWRDDTRAEGEKFSLQIQLPKEKGGKASPAPITPHNEAKSNGFAPQTDGSDDIPF